MKTDATLPEDHRPPDACQRQQPGQNEQREKRDKADGRDDWFYDAPGLEISGLRQGDGRKRVGLNGSYGAENAGRFDQQLKLQAPRTAQRLKTIPVPESALPITLAHNDARNIKSMLEQNRRGAPTLPDYPPR